MIKVNCPKCDAEVEIDMTKAVDESGEIYICPCCKFKFLF